LLQDVAETPGAVEKLKEQVGDVIEELKVEDVNAKVNVEVLVKELDKTVDARALAKGKKVSFSLIGGKFQ
jgi:hypothetical protein